MSSTESSLDSSPPEAPPAHPEPAYQGPEFHEAVAAGPGLDPLVHADPYQPHLFYRAVRDHVLADGRIVKSGGKALALELEEKGYDWLRPEAAIA